MISDLKLKRKYKTKLFIHDFFVISPKIPTTVIQLHDKSFEPFITKAELLAEVKSLGLKITKDYTNKDLIFIVVLNGAFMFASDLLKNIPLPCEVSFVKVSSYQHMESSGRVDELIGLNTDISNKHVVIIEDIVDTGITMEKLFVLLGKAKPATIEIASLLFKPEAFKGVHVPKYIGFSIPNAFVVGYGLDYNEHGRNLEEIYQYKA